MLHVITVKTISVKTYIRPRTSFASNLMNILFHTPKCTHERSYAYTSNHIYWNTSLLLKTTKFLLKLERKRKQNVVCHLNSLNHANVSRSSCTTTTEY